MWETRTSLRDLARSGDLNVQWHAQGVYGLLPQPFLWRLLSHSIPDFADHLPVYRGSKIQMFNVGKLNIRVLNSFNFLPMALGKLLKAFQLDSLKKGYFPHFFTSVAKLTYVGPYPPAETYGPDRTSSFFHQIWTISFYPPKSNYYK